jgi:hypothetical protein
MSAIHLEHEIRTCLGNYLTGEITLQQFEDWLVPSTWNEHPDSEAEQLSSRILLHISEFDDGWLSEDALKSLLQPLAAQPATTARDNR